MSRREKLTRETFELNREIGFQKFHKEFFADADLIKEWPKPEVRTWQFRTFWDQESERKYAEYQEKTATLTTRELFEYRELLQAISPEQQRERMLDERAAADRDQGIER